MTNQELTVSKAEIVSRANDYMPVFNVQEAIERRNALVQFTRQIMVEGIDFGVIPGTPKPTLLKPGAEKLCTFFGLSSQFEIVEKIQDWTGIEHHGETFIMFCYKCRLVNRDGRPLGEGEGSCNSWESKYRYRWVDAEYLRLQGLDGSRYLRRPGSSFEFEFALDKAETSGKYGKPAEYWQTFKDQIEAGQARKVSRDTKNGTRFGWEIDATQFRIPNPDVCDQVNTIQKMAQKRALIAATLISVNASEYYTQDIEDLVSHDPEPPSQRSAPLNTYQPPPAAKPQEHADSALTEIYKRAATKGGTPEVFSEMHSDFVELLGFDHGDAAFQKILGHYGKSDIRQFKSMTEVRKCMKEMYDAIRSAQKAPAEDVIDLEAEAVA